CRSTESRGLASTTSCGGVAGAGSVTSWVVAGGGATVVVLTSRSCAGVTGFCFGHPYITVNRTGTTIQTIHLRFILDISSNPAQRVQRLGKRTSRNPMISSLCRFDLIGE